MSGAAVETPELPGLIGEPEVAPARKLRGFVAATLIAQPGEFPTQSVSSLDVDFEGVVGDHHRGHTRAAGGREPWYPRGSTMRNERQITIVAPDELAAIAVAMGVAELRPEWIGANLVVSDLPRLSWLPPRTRLFFDGGAVLVVEGQNAPCRVAGDGIAQHHPERPELGLLFPKAAKRLRGLIAWVERPGTIAAGAAVQAKLPEQWIYR